MAEPLGFGFRIEEELVEIEVKTRSLYSSPLGWLAKGETVMFPSMLR